jgi:hypothetical protein
VYSAFGFVFCVFRGFAQFVRMKVKLDFILGAKLLAVAEALLDQGSGFAARMQRSRIIKYKNTLRCAESSMCWRSSGWEPGGMDQGEAGARVYSVADGQKESGENGFPPNFGLC